MGKAPCGKDSLRRRTESPSASRRLRWAALSHRRRHLAFMRATLFLALVASATGVILSGPSVVSDTYIRNLWPTRNLDSESQGWWDGPLTISATQVISGVTTDTSALMIKFDLRSFVGGTLMPGTSAWLNYYVSDSGNTASLRELVRPWNEVRARRPRRRALP